MRWSVAAVLLACACACPGSNGAKGGGGTGSGSGAPPVTAPGCEGLRAKVEELYRAEAQAKEPGRVEEAVADNTAMVLADCAKAPAQISPCVQAAATVQAVEACLPPLDPEGSEGDALAR